MPKQLRILVIGRSGQLAQSLGSLETPHRIEFVGRPKFDLLAAKAFQQKLENDTPDIVLNTAAFTNVEDAETNIQTAMALNRNGPATLAKMTNDLSIPFIHISTDYVFDGQKSAPYLPNDPANPLNVYGRSKLEGEIAVQSNAEKHVIIRTSWLFSEHGNNFVKTMLRLFQEKPSLNVVKDQLGTPTYAPDLARSLLGLCELIFNKTDSEIFGVHHYANSGQASWYDLASETLRLSRYPTELCDIYPVLTEEYPTKALRPMDTRLNNTVDGLFGAEKSRTWSIALKECIRNLNNNN